jgi:hypothetical protein
MIAGLILNLVQVGDMLQNGWKAWKILITVEAYDLVAVSSPSICISLE